jgi:hypothetical protein
MEKDAAYKEYVEKYQTLQKAREILIGLIQLFNDAEEDLGNASFRLSSAETAFSALSDEENDEVVDQTFKVLLDAKVNKDKADAKYRLQRDLLYAFRKKLEGKE